MKASNLNAWFCPQSPKECPLTTFRFTRETLGSLSLTLSLTLQDKINQPKSLDGRVCLRT